jgi:hypothetical protein
MGRRKEWGEEDRSFTPMMSWCYNIKGYAWRRENKIGRGMNNG